MSELRLFYHEDGKLKISKNLDTLKKVELKDLIWIDLNDVQELLLDSKELYFGETGNTDDVSDYFQAICLACVRAFPSKKIAGQVHVFVLLEGAQLDLELFNQGIEQLGDYCDDYFVTLGICESNLKEYHAVIFAGVEK